DILLAADLIGYRRAAGVGAGLELPQQVTGLGVVGLEVAVGLAVEGDAARGGADAARVLDLVRRIFLPDDLVGLGVDRRDHPVRLDAGAGGDGDEELRILVALDPQRPAGRPHRIEHLGLRIVRHRRRPGGQDRIHRVRRVVIDRIELAHRLEAGRNLLLRFAFGAELIGADREGLSRGRHKARVLRDRAFLDREDRLAGGAVEQEQHAVGAHRGDGLVSLPVLAGRIVEHHRRAEVLLPDVVVDDLIVPARLAGLDLERDDAVGVEIVAAPELTTPLRDGVADAEIDQPQRRIDRAVDPDAATALLVDVVALGPAFVAGFARARDGIELPQLLAGLGVQRDDAAVQAII